MAVFLVGPTRLFPTINAAIAAIPFNLLGKGKQEVIIDKGIFTGITPLNLPSGSKINASPADFIEFKAAPGDEHKGIRGAGVVVDGIGGSNAGNVRVPHTVIKDIEFKSGTGFAFNFGASFVTTERCLFSSTNTASFAVAMGGGNVKAIACQYFQDSATSGLVLAFLDFGGTGTAECINCVVDGAGLGFFFIKTTNCVVAKERTGASPIGNYFQSVAGGSNNASVDATAPGAGSLINQDEVNDYKFTNLATGDFHIEDGSVLAGAGIDKSSDFLLDIDLETIDTTNWPMGIDFPAAAGFQGLCDDIADLVAANVGTDLGDELIGKAGNSTNTAHFQNILIECQEALFNFGLLPPNNVQGLFHVIHIVDILEDAKAQGLLSAAIADPLIVGFTDLSRALLADAIPLSTLQPAKITAATKFLTKGDARVTAGNGSDGVRKYQQGLDLLE